MIHMFFLIRLQSLIIFLKTMRI